MGAPEEILKRCWTIYCEGLEKPLGEETKKSIEDTVEKFAKMGERVIAFCDLKLPYAKYPEGFCFSFEDENFPLTGLRFLGLMFMTDPPRFAVPDTVDKYRRAGIKVVMITNDHPAT